MKLRTVNMRLVMLVLKVLIIGC